MYWGQGYSLELYHSMGYMEMKRVNQELLSEIQSLQESSESKEREHIDAITQLAQEIAEQKVLCMWTNPVIM